MHRMGPGLKQNSWSENLYAAFTEEHVRTIETREFLFIKFRKHHIHTGRACLQSTRGSLAKPEHFIKSNLYHIQSK